MHMGGNGWGALRERGLLLLRERGMLQDSREMRSCLIVEEEGFVLFISISLCSRLHSCVRVPYVAYTHILDGRQAYFYLDTLALGSSTSLLSLRILDSWFFCACLFCLLADRNPTFWHFIFFDDV